MSRGICIVSSPLFLITLSQRRERLANDLNSLDGVNFSEFRVGIDNTVTYKELKDAVNALLRSVKTRNGLQVVQQINNFDFMTQFVVVTYPRIFGCDNLLRS